jgi:uracil-DNA glycosylase
VSKPSSALVAPRSASHRLVDCAWFQRGKPACRTAFVLSAPGNQEKKHGQPAAGETGKTLDHLLVHLHRADARHFPFLSRRDYRIVNAIDKVLFKRATRRTEAYLSEVRRPANLARLRAELDGIDYIVALGTRAASALAELGLAPDLAGVHPSLQKLNRSYRALAATPGARRLERAQLYAVDLLRTSADRWHRPPPGYLRGGIASS